MKNTINGAGHMQTTNGVVHFTELHDACEADVLLAIRVLAADGSYFDLASEWSKDAAHSLSIGGAVRAVARKLDIAHETLWTEQTPAGWYVYHTDGSLAGIVKYNTSPVVRVYKHTFQDLISNPTLDPLALA